jgi:phosphatidylinositol alpha-1,6-mannosyltransferase
MTRSCKDVLGLLPSSANCRGGVQESGEEAWRAIVARVGEEHARALRYEAGTSKAKAVLQAVDSGKPAKVILVWHLHLLKLLPFVSRSDSRIVLFLHGIEAWRRHDPVTQLLLRKVQLTLSNSDFTWSRFIGCNPSVSEADHLTVHLGTGSPVRDLPVKPPAAVPSVLMISRLDAGEDYKGHRQMIEAWPLVFDQVPGAELRVVGDGSLRPRLEDLARQRGLNSSVRFYGQVSDAARDDLIANCRALAMPSRGEGFGLVYLEAMRVGRPCLVSNADAGREVVNPPEAGLAADPDNPAELADAVVQLLSSGPQWNEWSARARARYEAQFTAAHFHRRLTVALFESSGFDG